VDLVDGVPTGTVSWTPAGALAIESGAYRFFSPTFGGWRDETGKKHDGVLSGGALTNKPHFNMTPVSLTGDDGGDD
jgi:phage I-like protein